MVMNGKCRPERLKNKIHDYHLNPPQVYPAGWPVKSSRCWSEGDGVSPIISTDRER